MLYRQNFGLMDVVDLIWRACIVSTRATLRLVPPRIDLHWDFEA